jgi:glycosyltransferase involved in cell wall biosynthesis
MTRPPRISIVVPVHAHLHHLPAALRSIRAQKVEASEVIVVDDGCATAPDDMVQAIIPDAVLLRQANAGPSAARNRGLRHARGELVTFLDSDDRWADNALARLARGFADTPGVDVVQGHVRRFEACGIGSGRERLLGSPFLGFNVGAMMARRQALLACGLFDERLWHSEDVDLFIRLHEHGARRLMTPDFVLDYRRHPGSLTAATTSEAPRHAAAAGWLRLLRNHLDRSRAAGPARTVPAPPRQLSVVMVVKNGMRHLPAALASLRGQTLAPVETIAVVGASEDGTLAYLTAQPDIRAFTGGRWACPGAQSGPCRSTGRADRLSGPRRSLAPA